MPLIRRCILILDITARERLLLITLHTALM